MSLMLLTGSAVIGFCPFKFPVSWMLLMNTGIARRILPQSFFLYLSWCNYARFIGDRPISDDGFYRNCDSTWCASFCLDLMPLPRPAFWYLRFITSLRSPAHASTGRGNVYSGHIFPPLWSRPGLKLRLHDLFHGILGFISRWVTSANHAWRVIT